jgi:hypothetical protein
MPTRNFGADTVKAISIIDTSRSSGLILISKDSTAMYTYADTMNMYTTAKAWKFTPSLPCCGDTSLWQYDNITNTSISTKNSNGSLSNSTIVVGDNSEIGSISNNSIAILATILDSSSQSVALYGSIGTNSATNTVIRSSVGNASINNTVIGGNTLGDNSSENIVIAPNTSLGNNCNSVVAIGNNLTVNNNVLNSQLLGFNSTLNDSVKNALGLGFNVTPASNQIAFSDSFSTMKLNLNGATEGKVLTVNSSGLAYWGNQILTDTATLNFSSIGAHDFEDLTLTVTGAADGDVVSLGLPNSAVVTNASYFAWVSATDTVTIRCFNINGGSIDPPSAVFKVKVFKD